MLISDINQARFYRLVRTFSEVYEDSGSLCRSMGHTLRFVAKKVVPVVRYGSLSVALSFVARRQRRANARLGPDLPVVGLRIFGGLGDYIVIARFVRDLITSVGPMVFDIYSNKPALVSWIFASLPGFRASFDEAVFNPASSRYTVAAYISQFVAIHENPSARAW